MSLNLNLFKRETLEEIGGVTEKYKFGFSEPILIYQIRNLNQRCLMVGGTRVYHFDQLTKYLGASSLKDKDYDRDIELWFEEYPDFASARGIASINFSAEPFSINKRTKWLWAFACRYPSRRVRAKLFSWIMWLEPWLTRDKDSHLGKSKNSE
ncbi:MAG: hypothetical protein GY789_03685 [Hyphomicrobiales bacterium]|nr:hypothetical protein [Hyphomicrobiales bacterium]MCP4997246.1 hypothetical protein [Hyphomicrobiales bacterium]